MEGEELETPLPPPPQKKGGGRGGEEFLCVNFSGERLVAAHSLTGFAWTTSWC
jgi:hypothetical protein